MINFLHTFQPDALLISWGPIKLYWYGLFLTSGIIAGLFLSFFTAPHYKVPRETIFDLAFWLIISGILGARIYEVFLEWPYYQSHPEKILQVWQGGLAIHGAIIAGLVTIWAWAHFKKYNFWYLSAIVVPGLAIGQAIGRWGNYFNQELFGKPTELIWGIYISSVNRPMEHISASHFHPIFLYESLGCLLIVFILIIINFYFKKRNNLREKSAILSVAVYMILYSLLRFSLEFIRLDETLMLWGWRWPQIISLIIAGAFLLLITIKHDVFSPTKR